MLPTPFGTAENVRDVGSLLDEASGGATDAQLTVALREAQTAMIALVTRRTYEEVHAYGGDATEAETIKREAFTQAEIRFAIARLPVVLSSRQLQSTGFKLEASIGRANTKFSSPEDIAIISDFWTTEAMIILSPYLGRSIYDQDGDELGFQSDDGTLSILSI